MGRYEDGVNEKRSNESAGMWIGVWGIIQMNENFHELGTGSPMDCDRRGIVNDLHVPKTNRIDILASDYWKIINFSKVFIIPEGLTVKGSIGLKVRIEAKKNVCY